MIDLGVTIEMHLNLKLDMNNNNNNRFDVSAKPDEFKTREIYRHLYTGAKFWFCENYDLAQFLHWMIDCNECSPLKIIFCLRLTCYDGTVGTTVGTVCYTEVAEDIASDIWLVQKVLHKVVDRYCSFYSR